jgi:hypothetical protein
MDAAARLTSVLRGGRRKRVVLISRRWDQAPRLSRCRHCGRHAESPGATVARKARTPGRARHKPYTIVQGMPDRFGVPVVTCLRAFLCCTQGCGCVRASGIPCALCSSRGTSMMQSPGEFALRGCGLTSPPPSWPGLTGPSSIPEASRLKHSRLWNTGSPGQAGRRRRAAV